jgi:type 2 lantibiotic biosynthesis protein LanM
LTVMYKPRSMTLDLRYVELVEWLNGHGLTPCHQLPRILDRGDYGWMEFVRPAPVADAEGVSAYYRRAGALVCLGYVLGSGDLHAENLVAVGDQPVVIDLETMLCPPMQNGQSMTPTATQMSISVLRSLLLPFWNVGSDGVVFFHGGGLGLQNPKLRQVEQEWRDVNTDRMTRQRCVLALQEPANVPHLDGQPMPPADHVAEILAGFRQCYGLLLEHRSALLAPGGAMDRVRAARVRVLIRDTHIYSSALRRSLHPRFLHDGFEHSLELEVLRLSVLKNEDRLPHWPAFDAEQRDLEDLDYPYFYAHSDDTMLYDSRHVAVGRFCEVSAYDQLRERMERLGPPDREHQETLIRFIYAYSRGPTAVALAAPLPDTSAPLEPALAVDEAKAIASALEAIIIADEHGDADWIGIERESSVAGLVLKRVGDRFFDGRTGTALFLGALDSVAGTGHAELAAHALQTLRNTLRDAAARETLPDKVGIGAGFGMGGYVYTLATIGRLTGDSRWIDDARLAALTITPQRITADNSLEVLGGCAGALLSLLSLYGATNEPWLLDRARLCANHLLDSVVTESTTGLRTWRSSAGEFVTGFAHGAGGIAAALLRAVALTGDSRHAAVANDALSFENEVRQPGFNAPSHLATVAAKARSNSFWSRSWCNGPVGVTLGQIVHGGAPWQDVIDGVAAEPSDRAPDHACCGTLGSVELLTAAGDTDRARRLMTKIVGRARDKGTYYVSRDAPDARLVPSFFQGLAGIGYHLLRTAHPDRLPSALAFQ